MSPPLPVGEPVADRPLGGRPARSVYEGRRVMLRPVDPDKDAADLFSGSHGDPLTESLWTYMAYGPFAGPEAMGEWLRGIAPSSDPLFLTVVDRATEKPVGVVSFLAIRPDMRVLELGHIWYVPRAQGTGANTEVVLLMLTEAFDRLGYRRVEWKCDALNERSRRAALRLGFTFEGVFRQHMIYKGRNRDTAWFALTDGDWPAAREALEKAVPGD